jgi:DNA-binding LacI/PurR family transcriptional regulator
MATMHDVAKHAGVSVSTVSYALNGTRPISQKTKDLIHAAMEQLGYRPHALARGLASRRSRIIALHFSTSERGIGETELEFVTSAAKAALKRGYHLVLWTSEMEDPDRLRELTRQGLVDGMVLMEVRQDDGRIGVLREMSMPFSMIGRCADTTGISFADVDFDQTTRDAVSYLFELGHSRIAFLNQSLQVFNEGYGPAVRAYQGFMRATAEKGIEGIARFCHSSPRDGYETFTELIAARPGLSAIIAMNDRAVPGVLQAIADRGCRVPEDFSLVSIVSSARAAELFVPPLTTMEAQASALGRMAVTCLIDQLEGGSKEMPQALLPCGLVVRGSTGPCRKVSSIPPRPIDEPAFGSAVK